MKGCILPFPKKGDRGIAKNYRVITFTAKIYNALLRNCIEPKIDKILRKNQNGFRRNPSTTSQIFTICQKCKKPGGSSIIILRHRTPNTTKFVCHDRQVLLWKTPIGIGCHPANFGGSFFRYTNNNLSNHSNQIHQHKRWTRVDNNLALHSYFRRNPTKRWYGKRMIKIWEECAKSLTRLAD